MPTNKAARVSVRKRIQKRPLRTRARTYVARARASISSGASPEEVGGVVREAIVALDRAASRGALHRNNASRRKSRLMRRLNASREPDTT